jgi:hypothetical protein
MLAYDETAFLNQARRSEAGVWRVSGLISEDQYAAIRQRHPCNFYTPGLFVRIALFLGTWIGSWAAFSFAFLILSLAFVGSDSGAASLFSGVSAVFRVIAGIAFWGALEVLVKRKRLFRAGVDDALLYYATYSILTGIFTGLLSLGALQPTWVSFLIPIPVLAGASLRFRDGLTTVGVFVCFIGFVVSFVLSLGAAGEALLPFVVMAVSIPACGVSNRALRRDDLATRAPDFVILKSLSLATFYLGGNYLIVRETSLRLLGRPLPPGGDIPWAGLFYFLTVAVPLAYAVHGLRVRDRVFVRASLAAGAFTLFTLQVYLVPGGYGMFLTLAGGMTILSAIFVMRYLRQPKHGITHRPLFRRSPDSLDLEAYMIAEAMGGVGDPPPSDGPEFGGGASGGAGAGRSYPSP